MTGERDSEFLIRTVVSRNTFWGRRELIAQILINSFLSQENIGVETLLHAVWGEPGNFHIAAPLWKLHSLEFKMAAADPTIVLTSHQQRKRSWRGRAKSSTWLPLKEDYKSSSMTLRVSKCNSEQPKEAEKCFLSYRGCLLTVVCFLTMKTDWVNGCSAGKESACNAWEPSLIPGSGRSPGEGIGYPFQYSWASLVAQTVKNLPAMWEPWVQSLGLEDPLEKSTATHSSILAWRIPMYRGAWWATVHRIAKCQTWLSN